MGLIAEDIDSSGVTLLGGDSLVCPSPPRVLPLTLAGAEARLLLEVAPAAWLQPRPREPGVPVTSSGSGKSISAQALASVSQAVSEWPGQSVEWSEGRGQHPTRPVTHGSRCLSSPSVQ